MRTYVAASVVLACVLLTTQAWCADVVVQTRVDRVTIYRQGATVARAASVELSAGDHRLVLRGLPDGLDPAKLRVSTRSAQVRLAGVELEKVVEDKLVNESERKLNRSLRDLQDQRVAAQDEIAAAETQLQLLDSTAKLRSSDQGQGRPMTVEGAQLGALLTTVGTAGKDVRARIREGTFKTREIDEQIEATKEELRKIATGRKATTELRANVRAETGTTVPLSIEYQVADAGWMWLYEARLDSDSKRISLLRQAAVRQGTGEDWSNIELVVSAAKPSDNAATPTISPLFVNLIDRSVLSGGAGLEEIVVTARRSRGIAQTRDDGAREPEESPIVTSEVFATDFSADYRIPGRVGVPSDRQTRIYPVAEDRFDVNLVARAVLSAERTPRLEATFAYEADVPIDTGDVQLYRDGSFIGLASLPTVLPGNEVRMPFGIDERIRVVVHEEREQSGQRGLLGRHRYDERKRRFDITSHHTEAIPVEVIDRVPVPKHEDVVVQVLDGSTPPTVQDLDGKEGVYLWRLDGTPRKTQTIRHYYSIRFPKDKALAAREGV